MADPYINNVVLLLHCDGVNGSATFTDSSPKGKIPSVYGSAQISSTKYKFGGTSGYFEGSVSDLRYASSADFDFGSGDFTIECWIYPISNPSVKLFCGKLPNSGRGPFFLGCDNSTFYFGFSTNTGNWDIADYKTLGSVTQNTWSHVAVSRQGSTFRSFLNGVAGATATSSSALVVVANPLSIGSGGEGTTGNYFNGYIDDLRITKGVARYTANFTPPTFALEDNIPISSQDPYYDKVALLLHCEGSNNSTTFKDSSPIPKDIDVTGTSKISTAQAKFGGSSAYFDGTVNYLSSSNSFLNLSSGDFTIECWMYPTSLVAASQGIFFNGTFGSSSNSRIQIDLKSDGSLSFFAANSTPTTSWSLTSAISLININTWYHIAAVRLGSSVTLYIDGISVATSSISNEPGAGSVYYIGYARNSSLDRYFTGYIDELRVTKGLARYLTNFTPTVYPFQDILPLPTSTDHYHSFVSLLLHCEGTHGSTTFIDNGSAPKTVTANGNASISSTQSKIGSTSAYFDGTGDYLTIPISSDFNFGTGDFTVEAWVYVSSLNEYSHIIQFGESSTKRWNIYHSKTGQTFRLYYNDSGVWGDVAVTGTVSFNTWYYVAVVKNGTTVNFYLNGSNTYSSTTLGLPIGNLMVGIGEENFSLDSTCYFKGYIDEIRITKGLARYTINFNSTSVPFSDNPRIISLGNDAYSSSVSLLLHFEGSNGSTTFTDNSPNPKTVTAAGNAKISTAQSKFGGTSALFDGSGDYLTIPASSSTDLRSSAFTIEFWAYRPSTGGTNPGDGGCVVLNRRYGGGSATDVQWGAGVSLTASTFWFSTSNGAGNQSISTVSTSSKDVWHHYAVTLTDAGYIRLFVDGVLSASNPSYGMLNVIAPVDNNNVYVGYGGFNTQYFNGYIDKLRITKGVARYINDFTPTITDYLPTDSLDPYINSVSLLCTFDNEDTAVFSDYSPARRTVSPSAAGFNTTSTFKYRGGSCLINNATNDYIYAGSFPIADNSFTIEGWFNVRSWGTYGRQLFFHGSAFTPSMSLQAQISSAGAITIAAPSVSGAVLTLSAGIIPGKWYHIAFVRNGSTISTFVNGVKLGSTVISGVISTSANNFYIGRGSDWGTNNICSFDGYINDFRVTVGISRYTANFNPPGSLRDTFNLLQDPYYSNNTLELFFDGSTTETKLKDASSLGKHVALYGNASISNTIYKYSKSSVYLDGVNSSVQIEKSSNYGISSGDFTIEGWFYIIPNGSGLNHLLQVNYGSLSSRWNVFYNTTDSTLNLWMNGNLVSCVISASVWNHVAVVRLGSVTTLFINGGSMGTTSVTLPSGVPSITLGTQFYSPLAPDYFKGYIDEFRITSMARYTSSFSPPINYFLINRILEIVRILGVSSFGTFLQWSGLPPKMINLPVEIGRGYYEWIIKPPKMVNLPVEFGIGYLSWNTLPPKMITLPIEFGHEQKIVTWWSGNSTIFGVITINSIPAKRRVRLFDSITGICLKEIISNSEGEFVFLNLRKDLTYTISTTDRGENYNDVLTANVFPV